MNRFLLVLPALLSAALFAIPGFASAAVGDFTGSIVPAACNCVEGAGWGCLLAVLKNILSFAIYFGVLASVITAAYAGFLWVTNPLNVENRGKASQTLWNAAIGLVIALSAWLIVNTVFTVLTNQTLGSATAIFGSGANCLPTAATPNGSGGTNNIQSVPTEPAPDADGSFSYDSGIQAQVSHESSSLSALLSCMAGRVPGNVGRISSISDSQITSGAQTFASCAANGCSHAAHSCHYGGTSCVGQSYAVDFGDEQNTAVLSAAANACGAQFVYPEGNHLHVSVGRECGCN